MWQSPSSFRTKGKRGGGGAGARGDSAPHTGAPTPPTLPPGERGGGGGVTRSGLGEGKEEGQLVKPPDMARRARSDPCPPSHPPRGGSNQGRLVSCCVPLPPPTRAHVLDTTRRGKNRRDRRKRHTNNVEHTTQGGSPELFQKSANNSPPHLPRTFFGLEGAHAAGRGPPGGTITEVPPPWGVWDATKPNCRRPKTHRHKARRGTSWAGGREPCHILVSCRMGHQGRRQRRSLRNSVTQEQLFPKAECGVFFFLLVCWARPFQSLWLVCGRVPLGEARHRHFVLHRA